MEERIQYNNFVTTKFHADKGRMTDGFFSRMSLKLERKGRCSAPTLSRISTPLPPCDPNYDRDPDNGLSSGGDP